MTAQASCISGGLGVSGTRGSGDGVPSGRSLIDETLQLHLLLGGDDLGVVDRVRGSSPGGRRAARA